MIDLASVDISSVAEARDRMRSDGRWLSMPDAVWARFAVVLDRASGDSILDVGYGSGGFLDAVWLSGRFGRVVGVEPRVRAVRGQPWERVQASGGRLPFGAGEFDTVSAQEVLEHLDEVEPVLGELRRVCRQKLVITVPFDEPWPPATKGHLQRFDEARISALFPTADVTILEKGNGRYPWAMLEERWT